MSTTSTRVSRSPYILCNVPCSACDANAAYGPSRVRAKKGDERVLPEGMNAERHGVAHEVIAGCTESNTPCTRPSFNSSGTVRKPKWVVFPELAEAGLELAADCCRCAFYGCKGVDEWQSRHSRMILGKNTQHLEFRWVEDLGRQKKLRE